MGFVSYQFWATIIPFSYTKSRVSYEFRSQQFLTDIVNSREILLPNIYVKHAKLIMIHRENGLIIKFCIKLQNIWEMITFCWRTHDPSSVSQSHPKFAKKIWSNWTQRIYNFVCSIIRSKKAIIVVDKWLNSLISHLAYVMSDLVKFVMCDLVSRELRVQEGNNFVKKFSLTLGYWKCTLRKGTVFVPLYEG